MNKWIAGAAIAVLAATFSLDAEAQRRLGGGRTFGKPSQNLQQRQAQPPQQPGTQAAPAKQPSAATAGAPAAAKAASPWRGALMGLAAGLGLAALASWLGFGEAFAAFMMLALLALVIVFVVSLVLRRMRAPSQPAYQAPGDSQSTWHGAGGPAFNPPNSETATPTMARTAATLTPIGARPGSAMDELLRGGGLDRQWGIPAGFDTEGFLSNARSYFGRLQQAWAGDRLDELSEFTTQEMFTALTHELRARGAGGRSEVVALDARLLGIESDAREHLASVRFTGTMMIDGESEPFDEVWNLTKPVDGKSGWLLAGIQQLT